MPSFGGAIAHALSSGAVALDEVQQEAEKRKKEEGRQLLVQFAQQKKDARDSALTDAQINNYNSQAAARTGEAGRRARQIKTRIDLIRQANPEYQDPTQWPDEVLEGIVSDDVTFRQSTGLSETKKPMPQHINSGGRIMSWTPGQNAQPILDERGKPLSVERAPLTPRDPYSEELRRQAVGNAREKRQTELTAAEAAFNDPEHPDAKKLSSIFRRLRQQNPQAPARDLMARAYSAYNQSVTATGNAARTEMAEGRAAEEDAIRGLMPGREGQIRADEPPKHPKPLRDTNMSMNPQTARAQQLWDSHPEIQKKYPRPH